MLLKEYDVVDDPSSWRDNLELNDPVMVFVIKTDVSGVEQERFVLIGKFENRNGQFYLHGDTTIIPGNDKIVLFKLYENQSSDLHDLFMNPPNLHLGPPIIRYQSGQLIIGDMVPTLLPYLRIPTGFSQDEHLKYKWVSYTEENLNAVRESTRITSVGGKRKSKRKGKRKRRTRRF